MNNLLVLSPGSLLPKPRATQALSHAGSLAVSNRAKDIHERFQSIGIIYSMNGYSGCEVTAQHLKQSLVDLDSGYQCIQVCGATNALSESQNIASENKCHELHAFWDFMIRMNLDHRNVVLILDPVTIIRLIQCAEACDGFQISGATIVEYLKPEGLDIPQASLFVFDFDRRKISEVLGRN